MWSPTHVQVTVQRAKGLLAKGGAHPVFVTIALGKEKYQTSAKLREPDCVEWYEKCELQIPKQGNTAVIVLTALCQNFLGSDQFLGRVSIPLSSLDVYERPKNRWFQLEDKKVKGKTKERGQLEVKIGFSVKAADEISRKDSFRGSLSQLSHAAHSFGGSLASLGSVDKKSLKNFTKSIAKKIKKDKKIDEIVDEKQFDVNVAPKQTSQISGEADPGVISDEDDFAFDDLSHTGSGCSFEITQHSNHSASIETVASSVDTHSGSNRDDSFNSGANKFNTLPPSKPPRSVTPIQEKFFTGKLEGKKNKTGLNRSTERIVIGGECKPIGTLVSRLPPDVMNKFGDKSKEELIEMVLELQESLDVMRRERKELDNYIENLLLRVMESYPDILQKPYRR